MREEDWNRLSRPYPRAARTRPQEQLWAEAVGIELTHVRTLVREISDDLDEEKFGVRWWNPQVDTRRRILIGDYLFQCAKSIEINLVEAALHCLEAKDYFDRSERGMRIVMTPRGPSVVHAPPSSAAADLPIPLTDMHVAGFFRGIGSAFDCAGAAMVGVLPLRARIQYADFGKARLALSKIRDESEGQRLQVSFRSKLEAGEQECGPAGWLTWTIDYRNALVHKARRLLAVEVGLRSGLLDARGDPILRTIHHPPRDPAFSEVDMWRDPDRADALSEDATTTMDGVLASAVRLIELLARGLLDVWRIRRSDPSLLAQPAEKQWPDDTRPTPTGFPGYSPGEWPYTPAALVASGEVLHRISAAALPDASRDKVWK